MSTPSRISVYRPETPHPLIVQQAVGQLHAQDEQGRHGRRIVQRAVGQLHALDDVACTNRGFTAVCPSDAPTLHGAECPTDRWTIAKAGGGHLPAPLRGPCPPVSCPESNCPTGSWAIARTR